MYPLILDHHFTPSEPIYDFKSFVFTERYQDHGDFQLVSTDLGILDGKPVLKVGDLIASSESSTVMITTSINVNRDDNGAVETTYKGKTLGYIFEHRPCVPIIKDKIYLEKEYKNGWEFGDKEAVNEYIDWPEVFDKIFRVAISNYGHPELNFLKLPIQPLTIGKNIGTTWYQQVYASFDLGSTMWDALKRIMENNTSTLRFKAAPHYDVGWWSFDPWPSTRIVCYHYRGQDKSDTIIFDTFDDSLLKGQLSINAEGVKNVSILSNEDQTYVAQSSNAHYFLAQVSFHMENIAKQSDYDWHNTVMTHMYRDPYKSLSSAFGLSTEVAPVQGSMKYYGAPSGREAFENKGKAEYWIGDLVGVQVPYFTSTIGVDRILARVTEFTRIEDETGYREYPTLVYADYLHRKDLHSPWSIKNHVKFDWN